MREGVGLGDGDLLLDGVDEGVGLAVCDGVLLGDADGVAVGLGVPLGDAVGCGVDGITDGVT